MDLLRRQFLQAAGSLAESHLLLRFARAFGQPLHIDETLLQMLEARTEQFWQNRHNATFSSHDLERYLTEHIQKILTYLEDSMLPGQRRRLCALASKSAQLAGVLTYDTRKPAGARTWYRFARIAAHESQDPELESIILGWTTFTWLPERSYDQALLCVQQGMQIASQSTDRLLVAWLHAQEAEIRSFLQQPAACLKALHQAERSIDVTPAAHHLALFNFDRKQLWGYQGACLQRLYRAGDSSTHGYMKEAQAALEQAISGPTLIRRRITYLNDLAGVYARQGEAEAACDLISQSLPLMSELGERSARKRLAQVRGLLEPAAQTNAVRSLDEQIALFGM